MSRRWPLPAVLIVAGIVAGCGSTTYKGPQLVAFGHSFVSGAPDQPKNVQPWPVLASRLLHIRLDNLGVGGTTAEQTASTVDGFKATANDVVVIDAMINNVRAYGTSAEQLARYTSALRGMIQHLQGARKVIVVADPPPQQWTGGRYDSAPYDHGSDAALAAYTRATGRVASAEHAAVVNVDAQWTAKLDTLSVDGLHPNARGVRLIADRVAQLATGGRKSR